MATTKVQMRAGVISPKAILALLFPTIGTIVLAVVQEVVSPHLDSTLRVAIVGVVNSLLALLGAYVGAPAKEPGDIVPIPVTAAPGEKRLGELGFTDVATLLAIVLIAAATAIVVLALAGKL